MTQTRPWKLRRRTALIVTALSEERQAVLKFLDGPKAGQDRRGHSYMHGVFRPPTSGEPWNIILPDRTEAGNVRSAVRTALSLSTRPDLLFMVGVAGGIPSQVNKYDVVVPNSVVHYEPAKITKDNRFVSRPEQLEPAEALLSYARTLQDMRKWQESFPELSHKRIHVWVKPIAAGEKLVASSSSQQLALIKAAAPRAVAIDNEDFGFLQAAREAGEPALVIRGISDLLDDRPSDPVRRPAGNKETAMVPRAKPDPAKLRAATHAAAFVFAMLSLIDRKAQLAPVAARRPALGRKKLTREEALILFANCFKQEMELEKIYEVMARHGINDRGLVKRWYDSEPSGGRDTD
jgi:nucleoside phosphorylase